jgi:CheY-like chemotaxis protein
MAKNHQVLVAEDEAINRMFLVKIIERSGYQAIEAQTGQEALDVYNLKKDSIAIILMDLSMPEMDGLEATRAIRALNDSIPILALTAHSTIEDRELCLSVGMNEVLVKPVQIQAIQQALERYLS